MLAVAQDLGAQTTWDRFDAMQPHCGFGELGLCCDICYMGPCRIDPFGERAQVGACGADAHLIVARNFARAVAAGAAAHSDHGREVVEALASGFAVSNPDKLNALAAEYGVAPGELAARMASQFGLQNGPLVPALRAPPGQRARWEKLGITPRGIDREVVELLHRTHQGVEADPLALLRAAMRAALADGWGGSMIATDVQDALFGGPQAVRSRANLGVLEEKQVNLLVHGHEPVLSEMIVAASRDPDLAALARQAGAEGINVAGICCTANEILMRQGMPVAGNNLHQELALLTGAVDLMVVDLQCIMPALPSVAACFHTKVVTTSAKAHIPGAESVDLDPHHSRQTAREIVRRAVEAFSRRDPARVRIPRERMDLVAGFTNENLPQYLGGRFRSGYRPAIDAVIAGRIRGIVGVVGCNTPRIAQDSHHLAMVRALIAQDVLVVQTGCSAIASAKAGLLRPEAALEFAGPGLREVCEAVGIPPVLHVGSCVDNSRILSVCCALVAEGGIGEDLAELPIAAAAPEAMSEKAVTIGLYAVASGIFTAFMPPPRIAGSSVVRKYLEEDVEKETGGKFLFANHIDEAVNGILAHLEAKRKALKLAPRPLATYVPPVGFAALGCGKAQDRSQSRPPEE
ncbi:MAG: anaerobic carbon-monoxide dehydrogenase catalytic subunit [Acidobacteria bacterium]|nr:anaerobic carbon-monoxide dehydrogenase catalytic subunit [Acidobacteriota bacterium]